MMSAIAPAMASTRVPLRLRRITSRSNELLKDLRRTFVDGGPQGELVAIEGVRMIEEAIRSGLKVRAIFFREPEEAIAPRLLGQIGAKAEAVAVPAQLFNQTVLTENPQGVAALVTLRKSSLEEMLATAQPFLVALAGIQDPGNAGTLLRSAEAFRASGALLLEGTVNAYNPKVIRAAAGSLFRLPVLAANFVELLPKLREKHVRIVAGSSHKGTPLNAANLSGSVCLLIGNEGAGVSRAILSEVDEIVAIPHSSKVESLNAAVAGSLMMYEAAKQRGLSH
jgi:TrmH family RNA methyltransferase